MKRLSVAVSVEHVRGWGRCVCEGIAAYARAHPEWHLSMFEDKMPSPQKLKTFDGFLWCVVDRNVAKALVATGKPVVDLVNDGLYPGTVSVGANHLACGQLAARVFITHHFRNFAFCGWKGLKFSDARQASYCRTLKLNRYECEVHLSAAQEMRQYFEQDVVMERLALPKDAKAIGKWLRRLPKPVGVFCANDLRAWQLAEICHDEGIDVPNEVAILGVDNDPVPCMFVTPSLSSIDTDTFETGRRGAEVLDELMSGKRKADDGAVLISPKARGPRWC